MNNVKWLFFLLVTLSLGSCLTSQNVFNFTCPDSAYIVDTIVCSINGRSTIGSISYSINFGNKTKLNNMINGTLLQTSNVLGQFNVTSNAMIRTYGQDTNSSNQSIYVILSNVKLDIYYTITNIQFYSLSNGFIDFHIVTVDCLQTEACTTNANSSVKTNFTITDSFTVKALIGYNNIAVNRLCTSGGYLAFAYDSTVPIGGYWSNQTLNNRTDYMLGSVDSLLRAIQFKFNVNVSEFQSVYVYSRLVSSTIKTAGNYSITFSIANSSMLIAEPITIVSPIAWVNVSCQSRIIAGLPAYCDFTVTREWRDVTLNVTYSSRKYSAEFALTENSSTLTIMNGRYLYTQTVHYTNVFTTVKVETLLFELVSPSMSQAFVLTNYPVKVITDTNITIACNQSVLAGQLIVCNVTVWTERTFVNIQLKSATPRQINLQSLNFDFSSNSLRFGSANAGFYLFNFLPVGKLILINTLFTNDSFVKSVEFYTMTAGSMTIKFVRFNCTLTDSVCIGSLSDSNFDILASFNLTNVVVGYNLFVLPDRVKAPAGYMVAVETDSVRLYTESLTTKTYQDYYYSTNAYVASTNGPVSFAVNADYACNVDWQTFSQTFSLSGMATVTGTLNGTTTSQTTYVQINPVLEQAMSFYPSRTMGVFDYIFFSITIYATNPLETVLYDFGDDYTEFHNLTNYNYQLSYGNAINQTNLPYVVSNFNTDLILVSTQMMMDINIMNFAICSYMNATVNISIISFTNCGVTTVCSDQFINATKLSNFYIAHQMQLNLIVGCWTYPVANNKTLHATAGSMIVLKTFNQPYQVPVGYSNNGIYLTSLTPNYLLWNLADNSLTRNQDLKLFNFVVNGEMYVKTVNIYVSKYYSYPGVYTIKSAFPNLNVVLNSFVTIISKKNNLTNCSLPAQPTVVCDANILMYDMTFNTTIDFIQTNFTSTIIGNEYSYLSYFGSLVSYNLISNSYQTVNVNYILVNTEFLGDALLEGFTINARLNGSIVLKVILVKNCTNVTQLCASFIKGKNLTDLDYEIASEYLIDVQQGINDYYVNETMVKKGSLVVMSFSSSINQAVAITTATSATEDLMYGPSVGGDLIKPFSFKKFCLKAIVLRTLSFLNYRFTQSVPYYGGYLNVVVITANEDLSFYYLANFTFFIQLTTVNQITSLASTVITTNSRSTVVPFTNSTSFNNNQSVILLPLTSTPAFLNVSNNIFNSILDLTPAKFQQIAQLFENYSYDLTGCIVNCSNNGYCHFDLTQKLVCSCKEHFTGSSCQQDSRPCSKNPCLNNGKCHELHDNLTLGYDYSCECDSPIFFGKNCEYKVDLCSNITCSGNGYCYESRLNGTTSRANSTYCKCFASYIGPNCDQQNESLKVIKALVSTSAIIAIVSMVVFYILFVLVDVSNYFMHSSGKSKALKMTMIRPKPIIRFKYSP